MKKLIAIIGAIIIALTVVNFQCNDNIVDPPPGHPPGYQEDIPWPSLADSPWPMNHHDPQSTGRSEFSGPTVGVILWTLDVNYNQTSAVINSNKIITAPTGEPQGLIAISKEGFLLWHLPIEGTTSEIQTTPLVDNDGTIYVASGLDGVLYAVNNDGTVKWTYSNDQSIWTKGLNIRMDGTILFIDALNNLRAVNKNGNLLWTLHNNSFNYSGNVSITFSPDGNTIYIPGINVSVFAVDINTQIIKWQFGQSSLNSAPLIDNEGNIYFSGRNAQINSNKDSFFSLDDNGNVRWSYVHNQEELSVSSMDPTMDYQGNIYFAYDTLYSIDYRGNLNWKYSLNGYCESPLISDKENNIYLPITDWITGKLLKFNSSGELIWEINLLDGDLFGFSPIIDENKRIYLPIWRGKNFYTIN